MMTAEEAMRQIGEHLTAYGEGEISDWRALARISRVTGEYERSKP